METVLSGIRPTGNLHLGNYFGALRNFIKMQEEYNCYFFIADLHSLTTHPTPTDLHGNVKQILVEYLAAGLDPEKATLYVQSDVLEVVELYMYLNMNAYLGELERCTSFKEKIRKQPNNVNAGLLTIDFTTVSMYDSSLIGVNLPFLNSFVRSVFFTT